MKVKHQPDRLAAYEELRIEWLANNPNHSDEQLLEACLNFAKLCGLTLRQNMQKAPSP